MSELVVAATSPKALISEAWQSDGLAGVTAAADEYAMRAQADKASKYVADIVIENMTGVITVTTETEANAGLPMDAASTNIAFLPNVRDAALASGVTGAIDWACVSSTNSTATARGLGNITIPATPLPARYAPSECR